MFGMLRPCRNRLSPQLRTAWMAHLCGLCLALRDRHGHLARLVTNYDGLVLSALVEAQRPAVAAGDEGRRRAGPCVLRGLKGAEVTQGEGARLAASASLLLASAQLRDHVEDGDLVGAVRTRAASAVAGRWDAAGEVSGAGLGLDVALVRSAVARQGELERALVATGPGADPIADLLRVTAPTEEASAEGLRATAVVAGRPANAAPLAEVGRLFGRVAHLLDAVEDLADDRAAGAVQPGARHRPGPGPGAAGVRRRRARGAAGAGGGRAATTTRWCTCCSCTSCRAPSSGRSPRPSSPAAPTCRRSGRPRACCPARAATSRAATTPAGEPPPEAPAAWLPWRRAGRAGAAAATDRHGSHGNQPSQEGRPVRRLLRVRVRRLRLLLRLLTPARRWD